MTFTEVEDAREEGSVAAGRGVGARRLWSDRGPHGALHALSSSVEYPSLNGGVRDYTEFHSQLLERWLLTDCVVDRFFRHYQTGEPMPMALIEKITRAATFNQGSYRAFRGRDATRDALLRDRGFPVPAGASGKR